MKKFLLSFIALAGFAMVNAEIVLDVNDATDIKGTEVAEVPKGEESQYGAAKHVQPLESLTISGYNFTFETGSAKTAPAYYWSMSTSQNQDKTIRLYAGNTMTMTAAEGVEFTTVVFSCKSLDAAPTGEGITANTTDKTFTWTGTAGKTITVTGGKFQLRTITINPDVTVDPTPDPEPTPDPTPTTDGYTVFNISTPGTWKGDANGYTSDVTVDGKNFTITTAKAESSTDLIAPDSNTYAWRVYKNSEFTIESKDIDMTSVVITYDDYNNGQYCLSMDLSAGWNGTLSGSTYTLTSAGSKTLTCTAVNGQTRIKTIVVSDKTDASISNIEAAEEGAMVIYNLRGQRLSAPVKGLNIINGKKVLVK
ncbi:MAG: hypothetical protein NC301_03240 [Bacteroides sp.]|nr:hypothetical protein [Bacteroides sp.]MCM1379008.1 hypothetical protein [Bacteroides sp.]MCM1445624.1 hypothetical protein [Prevotella sp.]